MSRWYVNADWHNFYTFDGGEVILVDCSEVVSTFDIDTSDVLSRPRVEDLLLSALSLWPRGAAWGAPGNEPAGETTVIAALTRALLAPLATLYRRAWQLTQESRAATLIDSLDDWELDYGLPDKCATEPQTVDQRRANLAARVARQATITPADVVRLAARIGFVIAVEEPEPFRVGETPLGEGCLSNVALGQQWAVHIRDAPFEHFRVSEGEVGVTRLLDFDIGVLECAIRRIAPAWSIVVFSLARLPELHPLASADGLPLVTTDGRLLVVPLVPQT